MSPLKSDSPAGTLDGIARICHEANRGYQQAHPVEGIPVALPWDEFVAAYPEQAEGIREGVDNTLNR